LKAAFNLLKETFTDWSRDKASRLAAALAYYTIFSIAPLLVIVIGVVGLILGHRSDVQNQVLGQVQGLLGAQGADLIRTMIENTSKPKASILATIIGIVTLILGATGVFGQLQDSLNTIWEVEPKPGRGLLATLRERFISFSMILGVGFLLLVSLVVSTGLAAVGTFIGGAIGAQAAVGQAINFVISFVVITLLFGLIYKILPDVKIAWSDVWIGAAATALLFTIGRLVLGLYLGRGSVGSAYGAAGSLVILLLWVYYSAQILFMGAEFTQVYATRYGSRIQPAENAQPATEEMRAQQGMPSGKKVDNAPQEGAEQQSGRRERGQAQAPERARSAAPALSSQAPATGDGRPDEISARPYGSRRRLSALGWATIVLGLVAGFAGSGRDRSAR
jgi:membrane protein